MNKAIAKIDITNNVHIIYDGRLFKVFKNDEFVAYAMDVATAKEYASHYVDRGQANA